MQNEWSTVATAWDANADHVEAAKAPATEVMLDHLSLAPGDQVLELGAGPGLLSLRLAELVEPGGTVLVSDVASGMVEVAARRTADLPHVSTAVLDASDIDRPDASFDVVVFRMGLMFTPDPSVALAEVRRVLAPGGRAGFMVWAGMEHNPWLTSLGMSAMAHGLTTAGPPVGPGEVFSLGDPERVGGLLRGAGFVEIVVEEVDIIQRFADTEEYLSRIGSLAPPLVAALAAAPAEVREKVHQSAGELVDQYASDHGLAVPGRAIVACGRT